MVIMQWCGLGGFDFVVKDVSSLQDADKGNDDSDLSMDDDEGIDAENTNMHHYSNGDDQFEINRPSATLKQPNRSGKPFVKKSVQGDFNAVGIACVLATPQSCMYMHSMHNFLYTYACSNIYTSVGFVWS